MCEEAHFLVNGFVNKQNYRFGATHNPQNLHQRSLHPLRVTVWYGINARKIYGPYFFENAAGASVTINGDRYRTILQGFLFPLLPADKDYGIWFQQDGATAHTARETLNLLREQFPNRVISKNGDLRWPLRSPDLTPPDFFL